VAESQGAGALAMLPDWDPRLRDDRLRPRARPRKRDRIDVRKIRPDDEL